MAPTVVVTGSTKGLGLGLVRAFAARGANVVVSGRDAGAVSEVCAALGANALGRACDVTRYDEVRALWDSARERFGRVDVWLNNAGTSNAQRSFVDLPPGAISAVVGTNLAGAMHGSRVALEGMLAQPPAPDFHGLRGAIYNMEGFGADGARQRGMSIYGSTKTALRYFTRSLVDETRTSGVVVGTTSPGIVVTDLLTSVYAEGDPALWRRQRWLFNFIADPVETVAPWLAERVLTNRRPGAHLAWMTVLEGALRFLQPRYWRRDLFAQSGPPA